MTNIKNKKIKLSIIIPIYGVEDYIADFLDSLLFQLTDEVECIFVDDGTKDKSMLILEEKLKNFEIIKCKILRQKNKGLSVARNNGLKLSKGEYFTFLDSDDEVYPDYISSLIKVINKNDIDVIHINADMYCKSGEINKMKLSENEGVINVSDEFLCEHIKRFSGGAWVRIFNKKYKEKLYFPEGIVFEDSITFPIFYQNIQTIYELPKELVKYKYRENSIMNNLTKKAENIKSLIYGMEIYENLLDQKKYRIIYNILFFKALSESKEIGFFEMLKFIKQNKKRVLIQNGIKTLSKKEIFQLNKPIRFHLYELQKNIFRLKFLRK